MKYFLFSLIFLFNLHPISGQSLHKEIQNLVRIETPKFTPDQNTGVYLIPMDFNKSEARELQRIPYERIESISLVYTQYKLSDRFNQLELNAKRIDQLEQLYPGIVGLKHVKWYWIAQTGCMSPEECKPYFHGFQIKVKSEGELEAISTTETLTLAYVEKYLETGSYGAMDSLIESGKTSLKKVCNTIYIDSSTYKNRLGHWVPISKRSKIRFLNELNALFKDNSIDQESLVFTVDKRKKLAIEDELGLNLNAQFSEILKKHYHLSSTYMDKKRYSTQYSMTLHYDSKGNIHDFVVIASPLDENGVTVEFKPKKTEYIVKEDCYYLDSSNMLRSNDHVVFEVFKRNQHWSNCLIATDVTGSMYPYAGQFLAWHKLQIQNNTLSNKAFVFFNDGDNVSDHLKKTGKVGGVYCLSTSEYEILEKVLLAAQQNGNGGDAPENNFEAVISGLEKYSDVKEVIMIADNWATPRDIKLLKRINKPIHFILCGASNGINIEYLNLARANGGTIHTMEEDLTNLALMHEGESIELQGRTYVLKGGKFEILAQVN